MVYRIWGSRSMRAGCLALLVGFAAGAFGQAVEVTDETAVPKSKEKAGGQVGTEAARKYFRGRKEPVDDSGQNERGSGTFGPRFMALQLGTFISEDVYKWGNGRKDDIGQLNAGVTYKMGEWTGSMDLMFKGDVTTYSLTERRAVKLSLMPAVVFPDVASGFPIYFGGGAGLGVFFKQIEDESSLSFDYSIFAGARVFEVLGEVGLVLEAGMKNHILLLSDGQYNGAFVTFGTVFQF